MKNLFKSAEQQIKIKYVISARKLYYSVGRLTNQIFQPFYTHIFIYVMRCPLNQDRLIFKGNCTHSIWLAGDIKRAIRSLHLGIYGCLGYTSECIFWSGMSSNMHEYFATSETCHKFIIVQTKDH